MGNGGVIAARRGMINMSDNYIDRKQAAGIIGVMPNSVNGVITSSDINVERKTVGRKTMFLRRDIIKVRNWRRRKQK